MREMLAVNSRADALVQQGMALVATISGAWRDLQRPLERLLKRLKAVLHDQHRLQRLFSVAKAPLASRPSVVGGRGAG